MSTATKPRRRAGRAPARPAKRLVRKRARGNPARIQILKAAAVAFRRTGLHGATLEEIAASLDMKKGNLWYKPSGPSTSQEIADQFAVHLVEGLRSI